MAIQEIKPYNSGDSKRKQVEAMFDHIAPTYDLFNDFLSFGIDKRWRKCAIKTIRQNQPTRISKILDVATGTGDLALQAYKLLKPDKLIGCDISDQMMKIGEQKVHKAGLDSRIVFRHEDCSLMSFKENEFDVVMSAFALRNFVHIDDCLSEMRRVMVEDGLVVVIDLCAPNSFPMKQVFKLYKNYFMPMAGKLFSHDKRAYKYLPATMVAIAQGENMVEHFRQVGFKGVSYKYLAFGMCCMYIGRK